MNQLFDLIKDLINASRERLKNPFIASFLISWILFNWKAILYYLYSHDTVETKINTIQSDYVSVGTIITFPVIAALFYTVILHWIMLGLDSLSRTPVSKRKLQKIVDDTETLRKLRNKAIVEFEFDQARSGVKKIQEFESELNSLKDQKNQLQKELEVAQESHKQLQNEYSVDKQKLLDDYNHLDSEMTNATDLLSELQEAHERITVVSAEYGIDEKFVDVTSAVKNFQNAVGISFRVSNEQLVGGDHKDPAKGEPKLLKMKLVYNNKLRRIEYTENNLVSLPRDFF